MKNIKQASKVELSELKKEHDILVKHDSKVLKRLIFISQKTNRLKYEYKELISQSRKDWKRINSLREQLKINS